MNVPFAHQAAPRPPMPPRKRPGRYLAPAIAAVAAMLVLSVHAAPPATLREVVVPPPTLTVTVSCANPQWPSLQEMGRQFGNDALDPLYRVRERMMLAGRRACRENVDAAQVTFEPARAEPVRALAVR